MGHEVFVCTTKVFDVAPRYTKLGSVDNWANYMVFHSIDIQVFCVGMRCIRIPAQYNLAWLDYSTSRLVTQLQFSKPELIE